MLVNVYYALPSRSCSWPFIILLLLISALSSIPRRPLVPSVWLRARSLLKQTLSSKIMRRSTVARPSALVPFCIRTASSVQIRKIWSFVAKTVKSLSASAAKCTSTSRYPKARPTAAWWPQLVMKFYWWLVPMWRMIAGWEITLLSGITAN